MKRYALGDDVYAILRSRDHFFDIFGVFHGLWTCLVSWGGLGAQTKVLMTCPWSPLGSISAPFFDENRVVFHIFF